MLNPAEYQVEQIQFFFLMLVRNIAMISAFPVFGGRNVPWQLKLGLSFLLSLILFPMIIPRVSELPNHLLPYALIVIKEVLVGLIIGFVTSLIFTGVSLAGSMVDQQIGFRMARAIDPTTGAGTSVMGQFQVLLFTIIFLALHGHQFLVLALVRSYEKIPLAAVDLPVGRLAEVMTYLVANIFDLGIRLAAPLLVLVLLTSVASGVLARTLPQMNLFVVNLPVKIGVGLVGLAAVLPIVYYVFEKAYHQLQDNILNFLLLMA